MIWWNSMMLCKRYSIAHIKMCYLAIQKMGNSHNLRSFILCLFRYITCWLSHTSPHIIANMGKPTTQSKSPHFRECPFCHRDFGSKSLQIHMPRCRQKVINLSYFLNDCRILIILVFTLIFYLMFHSNIVCRTPPHLRIL